MSCPNCAYIRSKLAAKAMQLLGLNFADITNKLNAKFGHHHVHRMKVMINTEGRSLGDTSWIDYLDPYPPFQPKTLIFRHDAPNVD